MTTKKEINEIFKSLSDGLLKEGKKRVIVKFEGFKIVATRSYNRPGNLVSWNPYYTIVKGALTPYYGSRAECVDWLYKELNR